MPKYRCFKEVWALKIKEIEPIDPPTFLSAVCRGSKVLGTACGDCERCSWYRKNPSFLHGGAYLVPEDERYANIQVDIEYLSKHKPVAGGYYVVYKDGYKSFSPAQAFEEGYVKI